MGVSIGELVGGLTFRDEFSQAFNKVLDSVGLGGESFKAMAGAAGIAGGAIAAATGVIIALGSRGAEINDVAEAFGGLSERAGETAATMLGALQEATLGTISKFDLMAKSNTLLGTGLIKSSADMHTLGAAAKLVADRTGGDTAQAFDTLSSAMTSGRVKALAQLGVFVDTEKAMKAYASQLGVAAGSLDKTQEKQAVATATLAALNEQLRQAGPSTADFADRVAQAKVAISNFTDDLSSAVAKSSVLKAGLDGVTTALTNTFGGTQQAAIKNIMEQINQFAITLTYVGQVAIGAGTVFLAAWNGVKTVVLGVTAGIAGLAYVIVGMMTAIINTAAAIPGYGKGLTELKAGAIALTADLKTMVEGLDEQTRASARAAGGNSDANRTLEGLSGALILTREAMEKAALATEKVGQAAPAAAAGVKNVGEAAGLTAAQIDAMDTATQKGLEALLTMQEQGAAAVNRLQQEITIANGTGLEARLVQIEAARQTEIAGFQGLALAYPALYEQITALVTEKYAAMTAAAQGHFASVTQGAEAAGFATQESLQNTANIAMDLAEQMKASGLFTVETVKAAFEKAEKAKQAAAGETAKFQMTSGDAVTQGLGQIFGALGSKFKAAAIAGAIIATYSAVAKALASAPWPANLVLAAGALAAGMANVGKIRSSPEGFAAGTPNMSLLNFGAGMPTMLHGREAVVNEAQGEGLASMLMGAVQGRDVEVIGALRDIGANLREQMSAQSSRDRILPILLKDAMAQARA